MYSPSAGNVDQNLTFLWALLVSDLHHGSWCGLKIVRAHVRRQVPVFIHIFLEFGTNITKNMLF